MKSSYKVYTTAKFKELYDMHVDMKHMAERFGCSIPTIHRALNNKPMQAKFIASVLFVTGLPFEKLFEVRG